MTKEEQERQIIEKMKDYFDEHKFDPNDEEIKAKLRNWIFELVSLEAKEIGYECEITHIGDIIKNPDFYNDKKIRLWFIQNKSDSDSDANMLSSTRKSDFFMCFNEGYWKDYANITMFIVIAIAHEMKHIRQILMIKTNVSSAENLTMAKEFSPLSDQDEFKTIYHENHDTFLTEEDAAVESIKKLKHFFNAEGKFAGGSYFQIDGKDIRREDYIAELFDELIIKDEQKRREAFTGFPILLKEYNKDGTRKSGKQLIRQMQDETTRIRSIKEISAQERSHLVSDCEGMYFELLYRIMQKASTTLEIEKLAAMYSGKLQRNLFTDMRGYFNKKFNHEAAIAESYLIDGSDETERRLEYYTDKTNFLKKVERDTTLQKIINLGKLYIVTGKLREIKNRIKRIFQRKEREEESK